jgi:hypothetical protein
LITVNVIGEGFSKFNFASGPPLDNEKPNLPLPNFANGTTLLRLGSIISTTAYVLNDTHIQVTFPPIFPAGAVASGPRAKRARLQQLLDR